jgi:hypothetical protein
MISRCRAPPPKKSRIFQKMGGGVTKGITVYFNIIYNRVLNLRYNEFQFKSKLNLSL